MAEMVARMNMTDALYHAASRYENDPNFQHAMYEKHVYDYKPWWMAAQLREIARRREGMHAEKEARIRR